MTPNVGAKRRVELEPSDGPVIPVYRVDAVGGQPGAFKISSILVGSRQRGAGLMGAQQVFAFRVVNDCMTPLYRRNKLVLCDAGMPANEHDGIVIEVTGVEGVDGPVAYLGVLISQSDDGYKVRQFNPPSEMFFPVARVTMVARVLEPEDIVGPV